MATPPAATLVVKAEWPRLFICVAWSDEVLKFLHVLCLGNVQVRIEDRRLMGIHDSTVYQLQDDDFDAGCRTDL